MRKRPGCPGRFLFDRNGSVLLLSCKDFSGNRKIHATTKVLFNFFPIAEIKLDQRCGACGIILKPRMVRPTHDKLMGAFCDPIIVAQEQNGLRRGCSERVKYLIVIRKVQAALKSCRERRQLQEVQRLTRPRCSGAEHFVGQPTTAFQPTAHRWGALSAPFVQRPTVIIPGC